MSALPMKWLKPGLIALAALVAVALALPFFISLDAYIPRIEKSATERLKEPVSIKSLRFSLLPVPHVVVDGLNVGTAADLAVGTVRIQPDLLSFVSGTMVIRSIDVDGLVLTQKAIDKIPLWSKSDTARAGNAPPQVRIAGIRLSNALVRMDKAGFGPFDARVTLNDRGEPDDATISTRDGKLKMDLKAGLSGSYLIELTAKGWKLPAGPPIVFDELAVKGVTTLNDASLTQISAKLYGGTITGKASANWRKVLQVNGLFDIDQVELKQLIPLLSPNTHVTGKLKARPTFSASAAGATQMLENLRLDTPFSVRDGVIQGVDIQKAATSIIRRGPTGGETRFDQLSGDLNMEHGAFHFTHLKIGSGVLAVDGDVNISQKKELSGRVNAQVRALGTSTGIPLNVAGTVDSPLLYPTGATLAGAAVGTALMGPGLGTTVGAKAAGLVEGLFGKKDPEPQKK